MKFTATITFLLLAALSYPGWLSAQCPQLIWADEFEGNALDENHWNYLLGDGCGINLCGWGNNELQYYRRENATVSEGKLRITARREAVENRAYTSARITTKGKVDQTYGRIEARIKLPAGRGLWPAFWMLPTDEVYGGWPQSGEIDIMEFVGREPNQVIGSIHYGQPWPNNQFQTNSFVREDEAFTDDWHVYAIEWKRDTIRWFVDDILYSVKTRSDVAPQRWPFDQDFHILLNVAVGGNLGGPVDDSIFPATMEVDYVRIYEAGTPYIAGSRTVAHAAKGQTYTIGNIPADATVNWSLPAGAKITSAPTAPTVTIDWGSTGGTLTAEVMTACGTKQLSLDVRVEAPFSRTFSFENFDDNPRASLGFRSGTLTEVQNPAPDSINSSALVGKYVRNGSEQYDVLFYETTAITNAMDYVDKTKKIFIDLYTDAPIGTEIILQLETAAAQPTNYPTGRHSRYSAKVRENGKWHRLEFDFLDRPDPNATATAIKNMILLFNPNTFTAHTYYYDNLDSYAQAPTSTRSPSARADGIRLSAYPSPIGPDWTVSLELEQRGQVELQLFDSSGRLLYRQPQGRLPAGRHQFHPPVPPVTGIYLLRAEIEGRVVTLPVFKQ